MTRKPLKLLLAVIAVLLVTLTAGVVVASTKTKGTLPEYVGSTACLGCHADKYTTWESSTHGGGTVELRTNADLPLDPSKMTPEMLAEMNNADYIFHGYRFFMEDGKTGEFIYTGLQFDTEKQEYFINDRKGRSFDATCGGCHLGPRDASSGKRVEPSISCESCHGPGRDHILGKGDPTKIWSSSDPTKSCASCHSGYNAAPNSTRFPVGYRPGMTLEDVGFMVAKVDTAKAPEAMHHKGAVPQWQASGHANATNLLIARGETYLNRQECIYCHSTSAGQLIASGTKFEAAKHLVNDGVSCVACHDPHGSDNPGQLVKNAQDLCMSCHSVGRGATATPTIGTTRAPHAPSGDMVQGTGAINVAPTKGAHTGIACIECHMSDAAAGNHLFAVVMPEDVLGTTKKDTCSSCHTNSSPESRAVYVELWKESLQARISAIAADVAVIDAAVKVKPTLLTAEQNKTYINERANFWYVQKDHSNGAHNFEYAIKILAQSQKEIAKIKALVK